jgi:hypothetical protein
MEDEPIPRNARNLARTALTEWFPKRLAENTLRFLQQRNWGDIYETAEVLEKHFGLKTWGLLLRNIAMVCENLPPARSLGLLLKELRKLSKRHKTLPLERELGAHARLLERPQDTP